MIAEPEKPKPEVRIVFTLWPQGMCPVVTPLTPEEFSAFTKAVGDVYGEICDVVSPNKMLRSPSAFREAPRGGISPAAGDIIILGSAGFARVMMAVPA